MRRGANTNARRPSTNQQQGGRTATAASLSSSSAAAGSSGATTTGLDPKVLKLKEDTFRGIDPALIKVLTNSTGGECYEGEVDGDTKRCGKGMLRWPNGNVYVGEWRAGAMSGQGTFLYASEGDRYVGAFLDDKKHGTGTYTFANGNSYTGTFHGDKRHGRGKYVWMCGDEYDGEWLEGRMHGVGVTVYANGNRYEGAFVEDRREGRGKLVCTDGLAYDGEWKANNRHGEGRLDFPSGDFYIGAWRNDKKHGKGRDQFANGNVFDGHYESNAKHGVGTMSYSNGDRYEGEWAADKMDGEGEYRFANGFVYKGEWRADVRHGHGLYTFPNGHVYDGQWAADRRHGPGTLTLGASAGVNARETYVGTWHEGKMHGTFRVYSTGSDDASGDGSSSSASPAQRLLTFKGEWKDGAPAGPGAYFIHVAPHLALRLDGLNGALRPKPGAPKRTSGTVEPISPALAAVYKAKVATVQAAFVDPKNGSATRDGEWAALSGVATLPVAIADITVACRGDEGGDTAAAWAGLPVDAPLPVSSKLFEFAQALQRAASSGRADDVATLLATKLPDLPSELERAECGIGADTVAALRELRRIVDGVEGDIAAHAKSALEALDRAPAELRDARSVAEQVKGTDETSLRAQLESVMNDVQAAGVARATAEAGVGAAQKRLDAAEERKKAAAAAHADAKARRAEIAKRQQLAQERQKHAADVASRVAAMEANAAKLEQEAAEAERDVSTVKTSAAEVEAECARLDVQKQQLADDIAHVDGELKRVQASLRAIGATHKAELKQASDDAALLEGSLAAARDKALKAEAIEASLATELDIVKKEHAQRRAANAAAVDAATRAREEREGRFRAAKDRHAVARADADHVAADLANVTAECNEGRAVGDKHELELKLLNDEGAQIDAELAKLRDADASRREAAERAQAEAKEQARLRALQKQLDQELLQFEASLKRATATASGLRDQVAAKEQRLAAIAAGSTPPPQQQARGVGAAGRIRHLRTNSDSEGAATPPPNDVAEQLAAIDKKLARKQQKLATLEASAAEHASRWQPPPGLAEEKSALAAANKESLLHQAMKLRAQYDRACKETDAARADRDALLETAPDDDGDDAARCVRSEQDILDDRYVRDVIASINAEEKDWRLRYLVEQFDSRHGQLADLEKQAAYAASLDVRVREMNSAISSFRSAQPPARSAGAGAALQQSRSAPVFPRGRQM